jgi:hypothetical protein
VRDMGFTLCANSKTVGGGENVNSGSGQDSTKNARAGAGRAKHVYHPFPPGILRKHEENRPNGQHQQARQSANARIAY